MSGAVPPKPSEEKPPAETPPEKPPAEDPEETPEEEAPERPSATGGDLGHYDPETEVTLPSGRKVRMADLQGAAAQPAHEPPASR